MQETEIVVIGAGVIGLSTALRLRQAGKEVTILERGAVGKEASWAGGGILSPLHAWRYRPALLELAREGMRQYPDFAREIYSATGIDPEFQASGMWILDSPQSPASADLVDWAATWGWGWQWYSAAQMRERAPILRTGAALFCPEVAQVRNPRLLAGLARYIGQLGVSVYEQHEVQEIRPDGSGWIISAADNQFRADQILLSSGSWSAKILSKIGTQLPIRPVRGQILLLQGQVAALPQVVLEGSHYLVQRADGQILVGSTSEEAGFDKSCTANAAEELLAFAHRVFPASREATLLRHWSGLRPGSPDNIPFLGEVPEHPGIFVASGHFRYGLTLAPITAELMRDRILGRPIHLDLRPYGLPIPSKA